MVLFSMAVESAANPFVVYEAVAVGEMTFQSSVLQDFERSSKTMVFVLHDLDMGKSLCEKSLYLLNEQWVFGTTIATIDHCLSDLGEVFCQLRSKC